MKAQRRHELKENDLSHALEVARTYLDEHGKRVGAAILIVVAVIVGTGLTVRSKAAAVEDHWRRKSELRFTDPEVGRESLDALSNLIASSQDDQFQLTALIELGQQALWLAGQVDAPPDPALNEKAKEAFEQLLGRFGDNPFAVGVAHLGLATVEENAFTLDREPSHKATAARHLAAIIDDPALDGIPFKRIAMDRRAALDDTFSLVEFVRPPAVEPTPSVDAGQPSGAVNPVPPSAGSIPPSGKEPTAVDPADDASMPGADLAPGDRTTAPNAVQPPVDKAPNAKEKAPGATDTAPNTDESGGDPPADPPP